MLLECMEQRECLLLLTFLGVDMIFSVGLIPQETYGYLEDMALLVQT